MADLAEGIAVVPVDGAPGCFTAQVDTAWEIWGPCGGYIAGIALNAAGAVSRFSRPASFSCHYLGVAAFSSIDIEVRTVRSGRATESFAVSLTQQGRPILEAMVLAVAEPAPGVLSHHTAVMPAVPPPRTLPSVAELMAAREVPPPYAFWANIDSRATQWQDDWPPSVPLEPVWQQWQRFIEPETFADPWVDAVRSLIWIDVGGWPAANGHYAWQTPPWVAVNVDLYVAFHCSRPESAYLLLDSEASVAGDGLVGYRCNTWSEDGVLVASGGGQLWCRRSDGYLPDS